MDEIPAFSIWETFHETIPALMSSKPSERSAEHLAKIIKSGDFSNIFVYNKDPSVSFESYERTCEKYKAFTTWFLGRFFYLLSCKRSSKSHGVYVDIQLCVLDQLSHTQLNVFYDVVKEYSRAFNSLTKFVRSGGDNLLLDVFVPVKYEDLCEKLNLDPVSITVNETNSESFLLNFLKIIGYIVNQSFDFQCYDAVTGRNLDDLLFLLSECSFVVKLEILKICVDVTAKDDWKNDHDTLISRKMEHFAQFFEQVTYSVFNNKMPVSARDVENFESLLIKFLEFNLEGERFLKISEFLLTARLEINPSRNVKEFCKNKRTVPLYSPEDFDSYVRNGLSNYDTSVLCGLKRCIRDDLEKIRSAQEGIRDIKMYSCREGKWKVFYFILVHTLDSTDCANECKISSFLEFMTQLVTLLIEIRLEVKTKIIFVEESVFFLKILQLFNRHFSNCEKNLDFRQLYEFFLSLSFCASSILLSFFDIFAFIFTSSFTENEHPGSVDYGCYKKELTAFCKSLARFAPDQEVAYFYLNKFLTALSSGFFIPYQIQEIEISYMKVAKQLSSQKKYQTHTIKNLPNLLTLFNNSDRIISEILNPVLSSSDEQILKEVTQVLPKIICIASSDFIKVIQIDEKERLKFEIYCDKCHLNIPPESAEKQKRIDEFARNFPSITLAIAFAKVDLDLSQLVAPILKSVLKFLTFNNPQLKMKSLEALPYCSNHILKFYSGNVVKIWVEKAGDQDEGVRRKFGEVAAKIIKHAQENKVLAETNKNEIVDVLFAVLTKLTKKSLEETNVKLQETILDTVQEIYRVKSEKTLLPSVKILIYLIMVPTSRHSLVAVNRLVMLAKTYDLSPNQLYKQYKREICELITHLCIVNQALLDYSLSTSLCKISVTLEFYSVKDFVSRECQSIISYFVVKKVTTPVVGKLIEEIALMVNMPVRDLLTNFYGNIFLHVFLNESKEFFKTCTKYLESATGLSSATLRKKNLWVILNELLLNFHENTEKVKLALKYLAKEDAEKNVDNVQEYLESRLLGLLQHFDFKLMGKNSVRKGNILLSLADFFKLMGPNYIGPLRFKIIAMLRTADCGGLPDLTCEVWDAFVRSCDVESLAPQLATIFVSLLPLIKSCPKQINEIFKYLVIQNENHTKEFIKDLFFVDDPKVDRLVLQTIRGYVRPFEDYSFKDKVKTFLKYLTHETSEVRIRSLKQLKILMEKNREELDQMILGYNGIDPVMVDLLEALTLGCREKDETLKLAFGEVIGELGAVEPSHLPRKYTQSNRNFSFFINDDAFIVSSLNELTKALQGEKNTVNMDRFAVAIQEFLKNYEISSDSSSTRHDLWKQFPESQQALMLPLLTSRYIVSQPQEVNFPVPIYGSSEGASFQPWLYNWTRSLIATLPQENQTVLYACLPAMKQDNRILMLFLPYILLHSIICDMGDNREKSFAEIKAVTGSCDRKRQSEICSLPSSRPQTSDPTVSEKNERIQSTKVVFVILDFLERWTREWQWQNGSRGRTDQNFLKIKNFTDSFSKLELAKCNFNCGEYPRALMYLEDYIKENPHDTSNQLTFLTKIFAQLDEPDAVAGVTALQTTEPPIEQRILSLEVSGKLSDAAACYERLPHPLRQNHLKGLIQCYLDLDNVNTALNFAQGALDHQPEFGNMLLEMQAEPLWRLGRYDDLDTLLRRAEIGENSSWGVQIGRALLSFRNRDRALFDNLIQKLKVQQADLLGAASVEEGAYQRGYGYISRLHALNELEQVERATYAILDKSNDSDFVSNVIKNLSKEWVLRLKVVQESVRIVEPLLCLRRVAIEQSRRIVEEKVPDAIPLLNSLLGECWLVSAKTARCAGVHQQSYTYTLKAEEYAPPSLFVEKSKLHWLREEHEQALTTLKRGLEILLPESSKEAIASLSLERRKICAEAKLLIASYNDSVSNVDIDVKTANYREACEVHKEWEAGLVSLAQFHDRRFQTFTEEEMDSQKGSELQIWMINYFAKSLKYGTAFVYQSMPRLLSIWFDYGTRFNDNSPTRDERRNYLIKMTKLIDHALEGLPAYIFLTAFSQIISRISHHQKEIYVELKAIIIKLLQHYPQQTLWMIISVYKSKDQVRVKRCTEIFNDPKLKTTAMTKLLKDFTSLAEKLIELCNKEVPSDVETTTVSALLRTLPRLLSKNDFSEIMIPTHKFRKLVLPNPDFSHEEHNAFPNRYVHIVGVDEEVTILRSLQRPRKITFRGSDGKGYIQMLKPKDDLRKDFRLMEFNDIVNQLLSREPESRQRRLNIRLYSVSPLNEECGLIEWIPNLVGLRPVLQGIYKQKSLGMTLKEIRDAGCVIKDPLAKKRDIFTRIFIARHPPVLGEWFRRTFPDAQSWFFARTAYTRTTAVISMVGYILGLGDRHGENILLDSTCGDTVHVDFNCLFNKGESFEWPERVPFRLTQNMVAAMGPLGVEGVFRKSCACALRVLRTNANTLMSVVTPFVYDSQVSWPKNIPASIHTTAERINEQALDHVKNIELRLQGIIVKTKDRSLSIPLSVEGQTNSLINEAMSVDNLCQMYIGWGPYL